MIPGANASCLFAVELRRNASTRARSPVRLMGGSFRKIVGAITWTGRGAYRARRRRAVRVLLRIRRPTPWAGASLLEAGRPRRTVRSEFARRPRPRIVGTEKGKRSIVTRLSEWPGTSMPCQKLATAKRLASALSRNSSMMRWPSASPGRGLGLQSWGDGVGTGYHRAIGEERQGSTTGGIDEFHQLIDDASSAPVSLRAGSFCGT